ncbi:MAG: hypothetical protein HY052_07525 [Proteobacteria bacterium]|nr:hypothetical protein [Pseudomonadota bacterium]
MKKVSAIFFCQRLRGRVAGLTLAWLLVLLPLQASAQCEDAVTASAALNTVTVSIGTDLGLFVTQETNFVSQKLLDTATNEVNGRLDEFSGNISEALTAWVDRLIPVLQLITRQLSAAQIDQTRVLGSMMDAQLLNEAINTRNVRRVEAQKRYEPSSLSCQSDTIGGRGQTKAYQMSRALARSFALEDSGRICNAQNSTAAAGTYAEIKSLWNEYVDKFCDNSKGDQGCSSPGALPGRHKDIPALLWGDRQTIDMSMSDNQLVVKAALRYLIRPLSEDPILPGAVNSASGQQALLTRRAEAARINTIYNVLGQMVAERVGGSGVNAQSMRTAGGMPPTDASTNASYREIMQSMTKDRFYNPQYAIQMVGSPEQVTRDQASINATRLQLLSDIYHRSEEMLFMEAAAYGRDLDKQVPSPAVSSAELR